MCGLCGMLGGEVHWTDRDGSADERTGARVMTHRAERFQRVALINAVLGHYGLALTNWQGSNYLLSNRTGRTEIVTDLAQIWRAAESMLGWPCDPLEPALVERLETRG